MTEKQYTIFDFWGHVLMVFGITVLFFILFGRLVGEAACAVSSLFALGAEGLAFSTLQQLFGLATAITLFRYIFFSDQVIRGWSIVGRTMGMLICIVVTVVIFVLLFHWFPADNVLAWICFAISFAGGFGISTGITYVKEQLENRMMEEALQRMNRELDGEKAEGGESKML